MFKLISQAPLVGGNIVIVIDKLSPYAEPISTFLKTAFGVSMPDYSWVVVDANNQYQISSQPGLSVTVGWDEVEQMFERYTEYEKIGIEQTYFTFLYNIDSF